MSPTVASIIDTKPKAAQVQNAIRYVCINVASPEPNAMVEIARPIEVPICMRTGYKKGSQVLNDDHVLE
jgi:hypothetical protein